MHGVLPPFVRDQLDLTDEQEESLSKLDEEVRGRLESILTDEQRETLPELFRGGPGGPPEGRPRGGPPERPRRSDRPGSPRDR
jgi:hypothetical protein